jgi:spore coat protein H
VSRPARHVPLLLAIAALQASACAFAPPPGAGGPTGAGGTTAVDAAGTPARPAAYAPFGPAARPDTAVHAVRLTSKPEPGGATWADLEADDDAFDDVDPDVPVIFQADGYGEGLTEPNGKASVRGKSTRGTEFKSFRIELKKDAPLWREHADVLLNKHPYDISRVRNRLAFDMFQALPEFVAPRVSFANLTVDGTSKGFYTQIERFDKKMLARRGLDPKGYLYQAEFFEFDRYPDALKPSDAAGYDEAAFEKHLEIAGAKDHRKLLAMLDAVNDENTPINATIDKHFDRANYVTWMALNLVTDNTDTNSQNFFLYSPAGDGPWRFYPWDYDGAMGYLDQDGRVKVPRWQEGVSNYWGVKLHRRFLQDPENVRQLMARIDELADGFFSRSRVATYLDAYEPVLRAELAKAPDAADVADDAGRKGTTWEAQFRGIPEIFGRARDRVKAAVKRPMPVYMDTPSKVSGGLAYRWDASFDLQGDAITYDLVVARDPQLADVVAEKKGLTATEVVLPSPGAGTYFFRVTIRDASGEWQIPFSSWIDEANDKEYYGVERFEVQ